MGLLKTWLLFLRAMIMTRAGLAAENLALRQQLAVLSYSARRPKLRSRDRIFWVWLSRIWPNWRSVLILVQPETVIRWHRRGFKLYWTRKTRAGKPGRPRIKREIRELIQRMSRENPTWGAPRILSELLLLGHVVAQASVAKYMVRRRKPTSQTWRTFLDNHVPDITACDFFTVTTNPYAEWTGQQIVNAFPDDETPDEGDVVAFTQVGGLHHRYTRRAA